jgi:hypothetical protein
MQTCLYAPVIIGILFFFFRAAPIGAAASLMMDAPADKPTPISMAETGLSKKTSVELLADKRFKCSTKEDGQQCLDQQPPSESAIAS